MSELKPTSIVGFRAALLRLVHRMRITAQAVRAAAPPRTPPTIAPTFVFELLELFNVTVGTAMPELLPETVQTGCLLEEGEARVGVKEIVVESGVC